ncbi:MAG: hypothetical protein TR69_WS6001001297 [candidate division WS6 bacterium OLB20]|uniref:Uncharacterized protein n=1 Tax=candidate division WS6 bacterium OLB20 TaxID=1617426 RepID=A0A136LWG8_9BACT|nr:MAG: hypothetical protein TR69_WS6001001297 [candidate division WS6 bacterium OLB20]
MKNIKPLVIAVALLAGASLSACRPVTTATDIQEVDQGTALTEEATGPILEQGDLDTIDSELDSLVEDLDSTLPAVSEEDFD